MNDATVFIFSRNVYKIVFIKLLIINVLNRKIDTLRAYKTIIKEKRELINS